EPANDEVVTVRTIEAQHIHDRPAFGGVDNLANAQQGIAAGNGESLGDSRIGRSGVNFFIGIAEFDLVIALEDSEERIPPDGRVQEAREFSGVEVTGFQSKGLARSVSQALELNDVAGWRKGEPRGRFVFIVEHFSEEHLGTGHQAAAGHLLGIAHQFIEVNFGGGDKSSDAATALDNSFAFERRKSVTGGHKADLMNFGEVTLGSDGVTRMQLPRIDALADDALNSLVGGLAVAIFRSHSCSRTASRRFRGHWHGTRFHNKNDRAIVADVRLRNLSGFLLQERLVI